VPRGKPKLNVDGRGLAGKFAEALRAAGFDFERPSLAAALRGYEAWLRRPVRGLEWGESDCAIVAMEPELDGTYEIDLRRHLGEPDGSEPSIGLALTFALDRSPALRAQWGTTVEAFDDPPAIWIAGELRSEPAMAAALAEDAPVAAELRINGFSVASVPPSPANPAQPG
jgi:hypothetical protein